ncbi:MAG TPA: DUF456 domain-containing protein [Micromonosporaceae bacterium]
MDLTESDAAITLLSALAIAVGIVGVIVPVLPGLVLCWLGVLVWAVLTEHHAAKWAVLALATAIAAAGTVVKYAWPGRNLKRSGVPNRTLFVGGALGLVGFFVIPVVGLIVGFVLGVWLAERARLGDVGRAWQSTKHALKAAGLSMLIELAAGLAIAVVFATGVAVS